MYALPKKGGEFYDEVRELMGHKKPATPAPVAAVLPPEVAPVVAPAPRAKFSFGSNIIDQVQNIKKTLLSRSSSVEEQKAAVRLALQILDYKENNINQEARKPLQRDLFLFLQQVKQKPKFDTYDLFGQSPASGKPTAISHNLTEAAKEIPVFSKNIVDTVIEEEKKQEKAQKKAFKQEENMRKYEEQERKKRDAEEEKLVDKTSIYAKFGDKRDNKNPSRNFLKMLLDADIEDVLDYNRNNKGKDLIGYTSRELIFAFPNLWQRLEDEKEMFPFKPVDNKKKLAELTKKIQSLFFLHRQSEGSEKEKYHRQILKLEEEKNQYMTEMTPARRAALKKFNEENNEHIY